MVSVWGGFCCAQIGAQALEPSDHRAGPVILAQALRPHDHKFGAQVPEPPDHKLGLLRVKVELARKTTTRGLWTGIDSPFSLPAKMV